MQKNVHAKSKRDDSKVKGLDKIGFSDTGNMNISAINTDSVQSERYTIHHFRNHNIASINFIYGNQTVKKKISKVI